MARFGPMASRFLKKFGAFEALARGRTHPSDCLDMRKILLCFLLAALAQSVFAQAPSPDTTVKVDVKLVNVFVTVTDQHGAPVTDLQKQDFHIKEDGKDQTIAVFDRESAVPLSIVLAIDTSLSTKKDLPL